MINIKRYLLLAALVLALLVSVKREPIVHYPPNPCMNIQIVLPTEIISIDGTFTNVYIKGDRVSIVSDESIREYPLDTVIITFDSGNFIPTTTELL